MPIHSKNFFAFFGLEPKLCLDLESLQKRFDELSRKSAEEQSEAVEATTILNNGYRTLRDPVKRAEYLLAEEGLPIGEQTSKDVPPELLEEVFELNRMLEDLKNGGQTARPQLETAKGHFASLKQDVDEELEKLFAKYDVAEAHSETAKHALDEIRGVLNRRRYVENLIRDVDRILALAPD
jgi:molecular chaperone HscB